MPCANLRLQKSRLFLVRLNVQRLDTEKSLGDANKHSISKFNSICLQLLECSPGNSKKSANPPIST
ncbi:hypothetical protein EBU99_13295 [bacterium]|nr:hypothetical protein [bacterium]